jgi:hypothetical protein
VAVSGFKIVEILPQKKLVIEVFFIITKVLMFTVNQLVTIVIHSIKKPSGQMWVSTPKSHFSRTYPPLPSPGTDPNWHPQNPNPQGNEGGCLKDV